MSLTPNSIDLFASRVKPSHSCFEPTVQIIEVSKVSECSFGHRYRVILSDGHKCILGMLVKNLSSMVHDESIVRKTIIKVKEFVATLIQGKTVVILLRVEVLRNPGVEFVDATGKFSSGDGERHRRYALTKYGTENDMNCPLQSYNYRVRSGPKYDMDGVSSTCHIPIRNLKENQNPWSIKARITAKSDVRTWSNTKGKGKFFSCELLDCSGDIRAVFFNGAVERFYNFLDVDKVYTFSRGRLKAENVRYNTCKSPLEIMFDQDATIALCEDDMTIERGSFKLAKIDTLELYEPSSLVDILAVVKSVSPVTTVSSTKYGGEVYKANLTLADDSGAEVNCAVWGERATSAAGEFADHPIVGFKKLKVSDYGGRSVVFAGGRILHHPHLPQVEALRRWWSNVQEGSVIAPIRLGVANGGSCSREGHFLKR